MSGTGPGYHIRGRVYAIRVSGGRLGGTAGRALGLGIFLERQRRSRPSIRILGCQSIINSAQNGLKGGMQYGGGCYPEALGSSGGPIIDKRIRAPS